MTNESNTEQTIDIGHTQVTVTSHGSGPDLVFVHGWPLNGRTWRNVVANLDGFRCHIIDSPGTPKSPATSATPLTIAGLTSSLSDVLDRLDLDRFGLVGQNSGAMLCRFAAADRTDVVGLGIIGSEIPGHHSKLITMLMAAAQLPTMAATLKTMLSSPKITRSPVGLGSGFHDLSLLEGEFRDELLTPLVNDKAALDSAAELIKNFRKADVDSLAEVHPKLTMPSLFIYGDGDPFFPADKARVMAKDFGGPTTFVEVPNAKLLVYEEYPELVATELQEFFADLL